MKTRGKRHGVDGGETPSKRGRSDEGSSSSSPPRSTFKATPPERAAFVAQLDRLKAVWANGGKRGVLSNIYGQYICEPQIAELGQNVDSLVELLREEKARRGGPDTDQVASLLVEFGAATSKGMGYDEPLPSPFFHAAGAKRFVEAIMEADGLLEEGATMPILVLMCPTKDHEGFGDGTSATTNNVQLMQRCSGIKGVVVLELLSHICKCLGRKTGGHIHCVPKAHTELGRQAQHLFFRLQVAIVSILTDRQLHFLPCSDAVYAAVTGVSSASVSRDAQSGRTRAPAAGLAPNTSATVTAFNHPSRVDVRTAEGRRSFVDKMVDAMKEVGQEADRDAISQAVEDAVPEFRGIGNSETARRNGLINGRLNFVLKRGFFDPTHPALEAAAERLGLTFVLGKTTWGHVQGRLNVINQTGLYNPNDPALKAAAERAGVPYEPGKTTRAHIQGRLNVVEKKGLYNPAHAEAVREGNRKGTDEHQKRAYANAVPEGEEFAASVVAALKAGGGGVGTTDVKGSLAYRWKNRRGDFLRKKIEAARLFFLAAKPIILRDAAHNKKIKHWVDFLNEYSFIDFDPYDFENV